MEKTVSSSKKPTVNLSQSLHLDWFFRSKDYILFPFIIIKFWYIDAPIQLLGFFVSLNHAFFELFSLPLFLKTFFKPIKNEYRQGLVGFSRAMGMVIKSFLIVADTLVLIVLLSIEFTIFIGFVGFPIATIYLLYM